MLPIYPAIVSKDKKRSQNLLTEHHFQVLWFEQKYFSDLITKEGKKIEVISPGIWNDESGPDFLKAHFRIGSNEYRGDVEIHLEESGWFQHRHHLDVRYNQVILHLFFSSSKGNQRVYKENGFFPFSASFEAVLTRPPLELTKLIDFDLYPSTRFPKKGRCSETLFKTLPEKEIHSLLISATYWRLERKARFLKAHFSDPSMQFLAGIALALGYKQNALAFMDLFSFLWDCRDLPYPELLAIGLGTTGFLEEGRKKEWEKSPYYRQLQELWGGRRGEVTHQAQLRLDHIRPLNHPVRRLVYLTRLLQDPRIENLWDSAHFFWIDFLKAEKEAPKELLKRLLSLFPKYTDSYWDFHYTFEEHESKKVLPGVGEELKREIILNTFLPLLYTRLLKEGEKNSWERFQSLYASITQSQTSKTEYLHGRFFKDILDEGLFRNAQMVQGAYQLHQDFCLQFESSCEGCPFVDRYRSLFSAQSPHFHQKHRPNASLAF